MRQGDHDPLVARRETALLHRPRRLQQLSDGDGGEAVHKAVLGLRLRGNVVGEVTLAPEKVNREIAQSLNMNQS